MSSNCKRYITFAGAENQLNQGWDAYQGSFNNHANAEGHLQARMREFGAGSAWGQIVDTYTGDIYKFREKFND